MRLLILLATLTMPLLVQAQEWRPTAWYEDLSEKDCEPMCQDLRVAVIGDSLVSGKWFTEYFWDKFIRYADYNFDLDYYELAPDVRNFARESVGVSGLFEQMWDALREFNPTHVVMYGGVNDCMKPGHTPEKNAEYVIQLLEAMIYHVQEAGVHPVIVEHHPWQHSRVDPEGKGYECSTLVNEWIEGERLMPDGAWPVSTRALGSCDHAYETCACDDDTCVERWQLDSRCDAGDGLHLSRIGQSILAEIIWGQVDWQCW